MFVCLCLLVWLKTVCLMHRVVFLRVQFWVLTFLYYIRHRLFHTLKTVKNTLYANDTQFYYAFTYKNLQEVATLSISLNLWLHFIFSVDRFRLIALDDRPARSYFHRIIYK